MNNTNLQVVMNNPYKKSIQERYPKIQVVTILCANFPTYKRYNVPYNDGTNRMWEVFKKDNK